MKNRIELANFLRVRQVPSRKLCAEARVRRSRFVRNRTNGGWVTDDARKLLFGRISAALHASNVGADDYLGDYPIWRDHGRFVFF